MKIEILETKNKDLLADLSFDVQQLHHEIEPDLFKPHSKESMIKCYDFLFKEKDAEAFVIELDNEPAGYMILEVMNRLESPLKHAHTVLHIDQICVDNKYVGKGLGKALVDHAKSIALKRGIDRIEMSYWTANNNSGEFFSSQGFENFIERKVFKL